MSGYQRIFSSVVLTPEVRDFSIAVQVFASIPPLLVLAGLLTTLHGELGAATMSGTLRCVMTGDVLVARLLTQNTSAESITYLDPRAAAAANLISHSGLPS